MKRLIISTLTAALLGSTLGLGQVHAHQFGAQGTAQLLDFHDGLLR